MWSSRLGAESQTGFLHISFKEASRNIKNKSWKRQKSDRRFGVEARTLTTRHKQPFVWDRRALGEDFMPCYHFVTTGDADHGDLNDLHWETSGSAGWIVWRCEKGFEDGSLRRFPAWLFPPSYEIIWNYIAYHEAHHDVMVENHRILCFMAMSSLAIRFVRLGTAQWFCWAIWTHGTSERSGGLGHPMKKKSQVLLVVPKCSIWKSRNDFRY